MRKYFQQATCIKILPDSGSQCYVCRGKVSPDFGEDTWQNEYTVWLVGVSYNKEANVGDTGEMFYTSEGNDGHYVFVKS